MADHTPQDGREVNAFLRENGLGISLAIGVGLLIVGIAMISTGAQAPGIAVFGAGFVFALIAVAPEAVRSIRLGQIEVVLQEVTKEVLEQVADTQPERSAMVKEAQASIESDPPRTVAEAARVIATVASAPKVQRGDREQQAGIVTIVLASDFRVLRLVIESVGVTFTSDTPPIVNFTKSMGRDARQLEYRNLLVSPREMSLEVLESPSVGSLVTISALRLDIARDAELGPIRAHVDVEDGSGKVGARRLGALAVVVDEPRWAMREQPILQAIDRLTTQHGGPTWTQVSEATGLVPEQVQIGLRRLFDAGYVTGIDVTTMGPTGFELINIALLEPGLKAVNAWPNSGQLPSEDAG